MNTDAYRALTVKDLETTLLVLTEIYEESEPYQRSRISKQKVAEDAIRELLSRYEVSKEVATWTLQAQQYLAMEKKNIHLKVGFAAEFLACAVRYCHVKELIEKEWPRRQELRKWISNSNAELYIAGHFEGHRRVYLRHPLVWLFWLLVSEFGWVFLCTIAFILLALSFEWFFAPFMIILAGIIAFRFLHCINIPSSYHGIKDLSCMLRKKGHLK